MKVEAIIFDWDGTIVDIDDRELLGEMNKNDIFLISDLAQRDKKGRKHVRW